MGQTASSLRAGSGSRFGVGSGNFRCPPPLQSTNIPLVVFVKDEVPTDFDWRSPLRYWGQQRPLLATLLPPSFPLPSDLHRPSLAAGRVSVRCRPRSFEHPFPVLLAPETMGFAPNSEGASQPLTGAQVFVTATQNAVAGIRFFRRRSTYLNRPKREMVSLIGDDEPTAVFSRLARIFLSLAKEAAALTS